MNKQIIIDEETEVLVIETTVDEWDNHVGDIVMF
jgi:hypothetical protein|tara:strand:+ start:423 stop:524 length:102 start_codon:yes stop_codon:yes gene_type:complete